MKLVINYDLFEAVLNAREDMSPFKVVRNSKRLWAKFHLPLFCIIDFSLYPPMQALLTMGLSFSIGATIESLALKKLGIDPFKEKSQIDLHNLAGMLSDMSIDTSYDMLLKTELNGKDYHLFLNNDKLPIILENKYLLVPSYNAFDEEVEASLLQEHVVGSKIYTLSLGRPAKKWKLAYNDA